MFGYIYLTTNLINGKKYIGRRKSEVFLGNRYLGSGIHLKRAVKKYGKENFSVEFIESADTFNDLVELERYYIRLSDAVNCDMYYNQSYGGETEGWDKGDGNIAKRPDIRKVNSEKHRGKKMPNDFGEKISEILKGRHIEGHPCPEFLKIENSCRTKEYNLTKRDYTKMALNY